MDKKKLSLNLVESLRKHTPSFKECKRFSMLILNYVFCKLDLLCSTLIPSATYQMKGKTKKLLEKINGMSHFGDNSYVTRKTKQPMDSTFTIGG